VVTLTTEVLATMRAHAERAFPEECVGALLSQGELLVTALPLTNIADDRRASFLLSARDYLAVEAEARRQGLELRGFYHSHPDGPAVPSLDDAASASPGWWTVILSVMGGVASAPRVFRFEQERFIEGSLS
jgi:proteasome lid subunit RPN8/RPN11